MSLSAIVHLFMISARSAWKKLALQLAILTWLFISTATGGSDVSMAALSVLLPLFLTILGPLDLMTVSASLGNSGWSQILSLYRGRGGAFWAAYLLANGYLVVLVTAFMIGAVVIDPSAIELAGLSWAIVMGYLLAIAAVIFGGGFGNIIWVRGAVVLAPIVLIRSGCGDSALDPTTWSVGQAVEIGALVLLIEGTVVAYGIFRFSRRDFR